MYISVTLVVLGIFAVILLRVPPALLERYWLSFPARHGLVAQLSLTILAAVTLSMVVATILRPGHALMEQVNVLVVSGMVVLALLDFRRFRSRHGKP